MLHNYTEFNKDFCTPATPIAEGIIHFHHDLMVLLTFVCFFVLWMLVRTIQLYAHNNKGLVLNRIAFSFNYYKHDAVLLEIVWTVIPALILLGVAIPSFALLYSTSSFSNPELTLKAIGHQWYWSYEITDTPADANWMPVVFDSYLLPEPKDESNDLYLRLVCVDKVLVLPSLIHIRTLVTSDDVLHSFAVPAFGVKVDACPGRLNSINMIINREGLYAGACSELCGVNHSFMPINILVTDSFNYFIYRLSAE